MKINELIIPLLEDEGIFVVGFLPFDKCKIINPSLYERKVDFTPLSAVFFAIPYYSGEHKDRNISLYALPKDYHLYYRKLYVPILSHLKESAPNYSFVGFSDNSPIAEVNGAARCGVGKIGDLGQLITKRYGSHVFIGEILTDMPADYTECEISFCPHCGACISNCPYHGEDCFSGKNQKKGELDAETINLIKSTGCAWGCDICRTSCPLNRNIEQTPIPFFRDIEKERYLSSDIENMSDEEFSSHAFSFRGRKTIIRNLKVLEDK